MCICHQILLHICFTVFISFLPPIHIPFSLPYTLFCTRPPNLSISDVSFDRRTQSVWDSSHAYTFSVEIPLECTEIVLNVQIPYSRWKLVCPLLTKSFSRLVCLQPISDLALSTLTVPLEYVGLFHEVYLLV